MTWANARQTLVRFRTSLVSGAIAAALLVVATAVVSSAVRDTAHAVDTESSLSVVEIATMAPAGSPEPVTVRALEEISAIPGVESATGFSSVGSVLSLQSGDREGAEDAARDGLAGVFWAMPRFSWSQPPVISTANWQVDSGLDPGEVILPDSALGTDLKPLLGASLSMEYTRATGPDTGVPEYRDLTVVALYDQASPKRDGEDGIYLGPEDFSAVFGASMGSPTEELQPATPFSNGLIKTTDIATAATVATELADQGYFVLNQSAEPGLPRVLAMLRMAALLLGGLLTVFVLGIGISIAGTWSGLRRWDVGVLRSLGWAPWDIYRSYGTELAIVGLGIGVAGLTAGSLLSTLLSAALSGRSRLGVEIAGTVLPPASWTVVVVLGPPIALLLGSAIGVARLVRIEPDVALRRVD